MTAWERLVERYKDDRVVCNCRQAWYMKIGQEYSYFDGQHYDFHKKNDNPHACQYGCQSNQLTCKEEVANRLAAEFGI